MKFTIEKGALSNVLRETERVIEKRNTIPILAHALLDASGDLLSVRGTDLDVEVTSNAVASIKEKGATTVSASLLYGIVRKLPDGSQVEISMENEMMVVKAGRSRFKLNTLPVTDFPDLQAGELPHVFELKPSELMEVLGRTQFAISNEETRYYLNGIYLHAVEDKGTWKLRGVATDGHRLAQAQMDAPKGAKGMPGIIVPKKTVGEVLRLADGLDEDDMIEVSLSSTKIRFTLAGAVLTSKLIDGTFPDYGRVIPNNTKKLEILRAEMLSAVDRVSSVSAERGRAVKFSMKDSVMKLAVINPDAGTAEEELGCVYGAEPLDIGFNGKYMQDILGELKSDKVTIMLEDPGSPTLISGDAKDDAALYVLMPMRV